MAMDALREHEIPIPWSGAADVHLEFDETEVASETGLDIVVGLSPVGIVGGASPSR